MQRAIQLNIPLFQGFTTEYQVDIWFDLYEAKCLHPAENFANYCSNEILLELLKQKIALTSVNWPTIRQMMIQAYHIPPTMEIVERDFNNTRQQPGESVKQFAYNIQKAGLKTSR